MRFSSRPLLQLLLVVCAACSAPYDAAADGGDQRPGPVQPAPPVIRLNQGEAMIVAPGTAGALGQPLTMGPPLSSLPVDAADARAALSAFRLSCPSLIRREDRSGLTRPQDWQTACNAAMTDGGDAVRVFTDNFEIIQVGDGRAFATGYYEPEIAASRERRPGYAAPIYRRPADLIQVDLALFGTDWAGQRIAGRVEGGTLVPYFDRAAIDDGALAGKSLELAWAADPVELFFLQVQGSGRLRLPDGSVMRIGFAGHNGRPYRGIGGVLRDAGALEPGQASMQGIVAWLRANPGEGRALMRSNQRYVFFQELDGPGPLGAMGYPVSAGNTVAVDPLFVPMGAPVFLSMDRGEPNGFWVAQDTGGAITGANRFDTFWGAGDEAARIAGGMSARGTAFILVPRGTLARLAGEARQR